MLSSYCVLSSYYGLGPLLGSFLSVTLVTFTMVLGEKNHYPDLSKSVQNGSGKYYPKVTESARGRVRS